jgi:CheY-like chemotaxis protein
MRPTILVVDDEPLVRMDLVAMAEEEGFETVQAASASEALKILESRNDIRVVLTDIMMPGDMNGLALAHVVRERWPPTVIVICSGNPRPHHDEMPANTVFLSKPCFGPAMSELLSTIRKQVR